MVLLKSPNAQVLEDYRNNYSSSAQKAVRPISFLVRIKEDNTSFERIYNVLTSGAIRLETGELEHAAEDETNPQRDYLLQNMYLVAADFDEFSFVDDIRFFYSAIKQAAGKICNYFIYPTTGCNARCSYCYEEGMQYRNMTPDTAKKVASYIIEHSHDLPVQIKWFGGEPTLRVPIIELISQRLNDAGITFSSYINTNGYLFDRAMIRSLKEKSHLTAAQIPMDGMGEIYRKTKAYVNVPEGTDPWEKVLENIESALEEGIELSIRLNIGTHNITSIPDILSAMTERFAEYKNFSVIPQVLNEGGTSTYTSQERMELFNVQKEAFLYLRKNHVQVAKNRFALPSLKLNSCYADDMSWVGISPEGDIYKCPENIGRTLPFSSVGKDDIPGDVSNKRIDKYMERSDWAICRECAFYPSCINLNHCCARQNKCDECHRDFKRWKTERILLSL